MMRKRMVIFMVLCLTLTLFAANSVFAVEQNVNLNKGTDSASLQNISLIDVQTLQSLKNSNQNGQTDSSVSESVTSENAIEASAPPLTYFQIFAVCSEKRPNWEIVDGKVSTLYDHGGSYMYIATYEEGYARPNFRKTTINNNALPFIMEEFLVGYDNIVYGSLVYWDASGYETGQAYAESTSINFPWNKMIDSKGIK